MKATRVTKPPEERRKELIDTAERLFLEKGYDRTTVNDIVEEINVAKGTFYHYFKSKPEILAPIIEKNIAILEEQFRSIINRDDLETPDKLNEMLNCSFRWYKGKEQLLFFIHQESNSFPHHDLEEMTYARLGPPIVEMIAKGVGEGRFDVPYPTQATEVILAGITHQLNRPEFASSVALRERMRTTLEQFLSRFLGAKDFEFKLDSWQ